MLSALLLLRRTLQDDTGQDLVEYAILLGLITVAVVLVAIAVGAWAQTVYSELYSEVLARS